MRGAAVVVKADVHACAIGEDIVRRVTSNQQLVEIKPVGGRQLVTK